MTPSSDVAFTEAVKAVQTRRHSRRGYARLEERGGFATEVTPDLAAFLAEADSIYLATASAAGQPYVQHRGGPKGFVRVLDGRTLAFADYPGNRQFITLGNLSENDQAYIFVMDYAHRRRVKLWGRARVVEDDPALLARLLPEGGAAQAEQAVVFHLSAWDSNCPQHIPQKFDAGDVARALEALQGRLDAAEAEVTRLRRELAARSL